MENKAHALIAGLFTILLLIAAVLIAIWFNRQHTTGVPYELVTKLSISGLNPQAAVRYRGLDVGKVEKISFDPKVPGQLLVKISVQPDTPITQSTYGTLAYQGVTGIAYIELEDDGSRPTKLQSIKKQVARIEMHPSLLDKIQNRGLVILQQSEQIAGRLNQLLDPANQKTVLSAFDQVSKAATEIETIPKQLQPTLAGLPQLSIEAQRALASLTAVSKDIATLSGSLKTLASSLQAPDGPLEKVSMTAEQLGATVVRFEREAIPLTSEARSSFHSINRTLNNLNDNPQSIFFGAPDIAPGPGESGFTASEK